MNRRLSLTLGVLLIVLTVSLGFTYIARNFYTTPSMGELKNFNDIEDIQDYILTHVTSAGYYLGYGVIETLSEASAKGQPTDVNKAPPPEYSTTNVQVEGIDEADYVKTDGRYIYLVKSNRLYIINAYPPSELNITSELEIPNQSISGLYVYDNKIIIITQGIYYRILAIKHEEETRSGETEEEVIAPVMRKPMSSILVYDVSEPGKPSLVKNITFIGWIRESRLMNGILYTVVNEEAVKYPEKEAIIPVYYIDGLEYTVPPDKIYYSDVRDYGFQYNIIFSIDLDTFENDLITMLIGYTNVLYMSYKDIYVTQTVWNYMPVMEVEEYKPTTKIFKFEINGLVIKPISIGKVEGFIKNRLQLDEYKGFLRVSTYTWKFDRENPRQTSYTNIFILDEDMKIVGSLTRLAESEYLYATRYFGDYAYLVTYRRVDPLFVIDLSEPSDPRVIGKLKIPGFSSMLQPVWDNLIVGIGYETDEQARILGLKVSLFDVSDPNNPKEIGKIVFTEEGWGWSDAAYDIHAILKIPKLKYVGIPVRLYNVNVSEAYLIVKANKTGLYKIGLLELQRPGNSEPYLKWWNMYMRGVFIGDYLYIVTNKQVDVYDLNTLENIDYIILTS